MRPAAATPYPARIAGRSARCEQIDDGSNRRSRPVTGDATLIQREACRRNVDVERVLRQAKSTGPFRPLSIALEALPHQTSRVCRIVELAGPFRQASRCRGQIAFLERLAATVIAVGPGRAAPPSGLSSGARYGCRCSCSTAPTARVPSTAAGLPVNWPIASAMNEAPPS